MGLGPIAGVVGIAQGVSSLAGQSKQQRIAEAQAQANQKAAEASAALRQIQINTSRDYADYNARLNSLTRQFQFMQSEMGLQGQGILDQMNYNAQMGQLNMAETANQMGLVGAESEADRMSTGAQQQALGQRTEAAGQSVNTQNQLTNAAQGTSAQMRQGEARRAMVQTMRASTGAGPSRTSQTLESMDLNADVASVLAQTLQQEGISEQDIRQLLYTRDIAEIGKQLGINSAEFFRESARRASQMQSTTISAQRADATIGKKMSDAGRDTASKQLQFANTADANTDAINRIFAESGFQQQSNAVSQQLAAQSANINASRAQASASSPGLFDYLGMGLKAYSTLSGSGLFGGATNQQSNVGGGAYSIFTGGYNMTPYSGSVNDASGFSATGASFTNLPI